MSDELKHECGIAHIRLLKSLDFYKTKYGSAFYGINKMYLLMEKQHNRGQDGAGVASIKLDVDPGKKFIVPESNRYRWHGRPGHRLLQQKSSPHQRPVFSPT